MPTASPPDRRIESALSEVRTAAYDLPNLIGGEEVRTGRCMPVVTPHAHAVTLGQVHRAGPAETTRAIEAALAASGSWGRLTPEERTAPFLRAADLLERNPWRERLVAATMLELSKTALQAEDDVIAETADMIRANVANLLAVADVQPTSSDGARNHLDYRPLEGFVLAVSPFNYASMNHLALGPALLGNVVVWKPAEATALVSHLMLSLLRGAGLPDEVINLAHASADLEALTEAVVDGAFDYQGQKCSAASRLYVPRSVSPAFRDRMVARTEALTVGDPTVPGTDLGAVITGRQFAKHADALARARADRLVLTGGSTDDRVGWFVRPTVLQVADPKSWPMTDELFAPVTAAYVYDDAEWEATLQLVDDSTPYGLTGSVFATDDRAIVEADQALRYTAGNLTINDKPTGAVVGQQPFGGARASGTNDKVGTVWSSIRFLSPRSVKRREG